MTPAVKDQAWRFGAIVFFCGLPLLLVALVIANLFEASQASTLAARQSATLSQIVAQVAKHRSHALKPTDTATLYLASTSASLARAEIQDRTTKLVDQAGGRLAEAQITGTSEQEADGTVAIQIILDIDNKGLLDLLYAVETGLPLLSVSDLSATTNNGQTVDTPSGDGRLRVEMTVQGHFRKGTG